VDALAGALQERGVTANEEYVAEITSGRRDAIAAATADAEGALEQGDMPLKGKSIVYEINRVFGDNTILVKENGGQDLWRYRFARERTKQRQKSQMQTAGAARDR
jgi:hypothetical protein